MAFEPSARSSALKAGSVQARATTAAPVEQRDLLLDAHIGVHRHEEDRPQPIRVNIDLTVAESGSPIEDRLENVVDYEHVVNGIRAIVADHAHGAIEAHDLRSRHAGRYTFLEFHLVVPGDMTVRESHQICDRIEAALKAELETAIITIHVEPEHKAKHSGVLVI